MTKKLKLPLLITSTYGNKFTLSQSVHEGMIDLTASSDGSVYIQHVTEVEAIKYFENGLWEVVGATKNVITAATARDQLELAQNAFASAKITYDVAVANVKAAEAAVEAATKPYLA